MPSPQIREAQVDLLLQDGELAIEGEHPWHESANKSWLRIEIPVRNNKSASLKLCITANRMVEGRYRFALLFNTTLRIRGLCLSGNHTNKHTNQDRFLLQTHVHKWKDQCQDRFAEPSNISGSTAQELLEKFCSDCNIECSATLGEMPQHQPEMLL